MSQVLTQQVYYYTKCRVYCLQLHPYYLNMAMGHSFSRLLQGGKVFVQSIETDNTETCCLHAAGVDHSELYTGTSLRVHSAAEVSCASLVGGV